MDNEIQVDKFVKWTPGFAIFEETATLTISNSWQWKHHSVMSTSRLTHLIIYLLLIAATATTVSATDHIVGANRGWNPGINYTLWANNHTFYVGDFISFRYVKTQYNVIEVNKTGYDNCTLDGAVGNWSSGKDFILLNRSQRYYFICGTGGCFNDMKVTIRVHPLPSPPSSTVAASEHSSTSAAAGASIFSVLSMVLASLFWVGAGTIYYF